MLGLDRRSRIDVVDMKTLALVSTSFFLVALAVVNPASAGQPSEGTFVGRVTDPSGKGLGRVTVTVTSRARPVKQVVAITDTDGEFRTPPLPEGQYDLKYSVLGFETARLDGPGLSGGVEQRVQDAVLTPLTDGRFVGRVTDSSGKGRGRVTVTVTSRARPVKRVVAVTDTNGEFRTPPLPEGQYDLKYSVLGSVDTARLDGPGLSGGVEQRVQDAVLAPPPVRVAVTPPPVLLAVIRGDKAGPVLAFIDPETGRIGARVPLGADPRMAAVSADSKAAYVVNTNDAIRKPDADSISVIDLVGRKEIRRVSTGNGSEPDDIKMVGGKVYFALEGYKAVGRYDPAGNRVEWTIGLGQKGPHMIAVSRDQNTIVAANPGSNTVSIVTNVLKGPTGWDVVQVPVGRGPEGIDISPDGKEAWVTNEAAGGVSIIDVSRKIVTQHVDLKTTHANRLTFNPSAYQVALIDSHTAELVIVDVATRKLVKKIVMPDSAPVSERNRNRVYDVLFGSNGTAYVSVNGPPGRSYIGVVNMNTLEMVRRIETGATADGLAWVQPK